MKSGDAALVLLLFSINVLSLKILPDLRPTAIGRRLAQNCSLIEEIRQNLVTRAITDQARSSRDGRRDGAGGPSEFAVAPGYRQVIDARNPAAHQTVLVELPILIAVGAEPVAAVVVILIGEANGDTIFTKRPEFLDQSIIEFPAPFPGQEALDFGTSVQKLGAVPSCAVRGIR